MQHTKTTNEQVELVTRRATTGQIVRTEGDRAYVQADGRDDTTRWDLKTGRPWDHRANENYTGPILVRNNTSMSREVAVDTCSIVFRTYGHSERLRDDIPTGDMVDASLMLIGSHRYLLDVQGVEVERGLRTEQHQYVAVRNTLNGLADLMAELGCDEVVLRRDSGGGLTVLVQTTEQ